MRQALSRSLILLIALMFVLTLPGCGPSSPEAKVTAARAQYTVRLESFSVREPEMEEPAAEMAPAEDEGAEVAESAMAAEAVEVEEEGEGEGEMMPEEPTGPRQVDVILHLLVQFSGDEALSGITVEVTQQDPFGKEKEPTLEWIETADMVKSDVKQVDLELEGIDYEDGDGFSVLLSNVVSPEERSQYREYAEAGQ